MQFRRFNDDGIAEFRAYLDRLRSEPALSPPPPEALLQHPELSEELDPPIEATSRAFGNRMAFARWLHDAAGAADAVIPRRDAGFWAWLSLALFDQVCPVDGRGRRKPGADARHIPEFSNWKTRYRHLLANPYDVLWLHRDDPERAMVALINPIHQPGELTEQFTGRQELIRCPGTMALATRLYVDGASGLRRRGASGKSARRFGKLMNQYARTWDLPLMPTDRFASMLPREFDRFRPERASTADGAAP